MTASEEEKVEKSILHWKWINGSSWVEWLQIVTRAPHANQRSFSSELNQKCPRCDNLEDWSYNSSWWENQWFCSWTKQQFNSTITPFASQKRIHNSGALSKSLNGSDCSTRHQQSSRRSNMYLFAGTGEGAKRSSSALNLSSRQSIASIWPTSRSGWTSALGGLWPAAPSATWILSETSSTQLKYDFFRYVTCGTQPRLPVWLFPSCCRK